MKVSLCNHYGPPEVAEIAEVSVPVPGPGEILVQVQASSVNRTDCAFRSGESFISRLWSGLLKPKRKILGCEFAGIVEKTGPQVKSFTKGDHVFGFNARTFGAHAEYLVVPENSPVMKMPAGITFQEAACLSEGAHYALAHVRALNLRPGQEVLVNGATGAIGSAAVQLLVYYGARVTAVCQGKHGDLVRALGAEVVIDYTSQDFTSTDKRFDLIVDAVGKSSFAQCKRILSKTRYIHFH